MANIKRKVMEAINATIWGNPNVEVFVTMNFLDKSSKSSQNSLQKPGNICNLPWMHAVRHRVGVPLDSVA